MTGTKGLIRFAAVAAAFVLILAACGDSGDDAAADTAAPPTTAMEDMGDEEEGHEEEGHDEHGDFDFGEPADAGDADRVVDIVAQDDFTFTPASLPVAVGETITFRVTNEGAIPHDFTLGRSDLQDAHDIEMAEMEGMAMEDEPNAFMIEPGQTKELTWHFTEPGEVLIGCHVVGHYAAGMKATISVDA